MNYNELYKMNSGGLLTERSYNQYFNPNICHVCKKLDEGNLMPCDACGLISYCCDEHRIMHQTSHNDVCTVMVSATAHWSVRTDLELNTVYDSKDWIISQQQSISFIQQNIRRDLQPYEVEMILCAKLCFRCHRRIGLRTCTICYSTSYCTDCETYFIAQHTGCYLNAFILLAINLFSTYSSPNLAYPDKMKFTTFPESKCFNNMDTFVNAYIARNKTKIQKDTCWGADYIYSDYMSNPLTLYHTCKELDMLHILNNRDLFVIHILAPSAIDVTGIRAWVKQRCR